MTSIAILTNVLGLAIGAGLNLYAAVLVTGLGIRYGWLPQLPPDLAILGHPVVLGLAGALYVAEFVADKVPFFTPIWDGIHTFIRPVGGALLAFGAAGDLDPMVRMLAMLAAGTVALGTHSSKMGVRLMAHTTPEPTTHAAISIAEDVTVVGLLLLAYQYPYVALPVLMLVIFGIAMLLPLLLRVAKFVISGLWGRVLTRPIDDKPEWVLGQAHSVKAYTRKVRGAPRLQEGYLLLFGTKTQFAYRSWGRTKIVDVGALEGSPEWGFVYNLVRFGSGATFYLTKEWCPVFTSPVPAEASLQSLDYK